MKTKIVYLNFLLAIIACNVHSQGKDSLLLEIKSLRKTGIILHFTGEHPVSMNENLNKVIIKSSSFPFIVRSAAQLDAIVVISNTEGDNIQTFKLTDLNKNYKIDSLISPETLLNGIINIKIFNKNNTTLKSFPIRFNLTEENNSATNNSNFKTTLNPNDYKVGSPVYDAMYLANANGTIGRKAQILSFYAHGDSDLIRAYSDNKFLNSIVINTIGIKAENQLGLSSIFSSIGGLDVTGFADGAAKFIVKRARQELSIAFFQKFKKIIQGTPDIKTVFPQTANLLDGLDEEIYEYEKYVQNLREAFKMDIKAIHRNLPGIIDNHTAFFSKHQEVKCALLTACYTAQELEDQAHPADILANYPIEYLDSIENKNYKGSIQTIQLLSASLRDTSSAEEAPYWANIKQIRELVNNKLALKIYFGLILQEAKIKYGSIPFEGMSLVEILNKVATEYDKGFAVYNSYKTYVLRFGEKVEALNKMIKDYRNEDTSDSAIVEKYAKYFRTSVDLIAYSSEICNLPIVRDIDHLKEFPILLNKYFDVAYSSTDLVVDINRKNYSSAINQAVHIYNIVTVTPAREQPEVTVTEIKENTTIHEPGDSMHVAKSNLMMSKNTVTTTYTTFKTTLDRLVKYGSFMATVATAKNSDDVEKAIETAALPVGSSRIKRVSDFNVSLNAYAGLFYGIERIKGVDSGSAKFNSFGVAAPIGVAASWGHRLFFIPTGDCEWSTSLFVSLIDLGAVAAFRFKDDSTAQVPSIELKDIFSPGAFLSIGVPKTPLSFNFGAQVGPNLRKIGDGKNDYGNNVYWRYSISVCVDIPALNFYTKSK